MTSETSREHALREFFELRLQRLRVAAAPTGRTAVEWVDSIRLRSPETGAAEEVIIRLRSGTSFVPEELERLATQIRAAHTDLYGERAALETLLVEVP